MSPRFKKGTVVRVLAKHDNGWWKGEVPGVGEGLFPSTYVEALSDETGLSRLESSDISQATVSKIVLQDVQISMRAPQSLKRGCKALVDSCASTNVCFFGLPSALLALLSPSHPLPIIPCLSTTAAKESHYQFTVRSLSTDEVYPIMLVRSGDLAPPDSDAMVDMWVEALQSAAAMASEPGLSRCVFGSSLHTGVAVILLARTVVSDIKCVVDFSSYIDPEAPLTLVDEQPL